LWNKRTSFGRLEVAYCAVSNTSRVGLSERGSTNAYALSAF